MAFPVNRWRRLFVPVIRFSDTTLDLIWERHRDVLKQGSILVDEEDLGETFRILVTLEHAIQDARTDKTGKQRVISRRMHYVEIEKRESQTPTFVMLATLLT